MNHKIIKGDVTGVLDEFEENTFSGCICDPPYHLTQNSRGGSPRKPGTGPFGRHHLGEKGFAGQTWDGGDVAFRKETWEKVYRALKPGAYLMAFGATRTFHRMVCAIEDAGFEIRDTIMWVYGSGMPKSLDISKNFDRKAGAKREIVGKYQPPGMDKPWNLKNAKDERSVEVFASSRNNLDVTAPATDIAKIWDGYGTSLKPAVEPIILAMKPLDGTYTENAEKWGVSGLNIQASRIDSGSELITINTWNDGAKPFGGGAGHPYTSRQSQGRWPTNLILGCSCEGEHSADCPVSVMERQLDGASRFFYCTKVSTKERNAGLGKSDNPHPTMKPISLTQYLASMICPPKGNDSRRVLVPFSGVGSEMIGCLLSGWDEVVGIESGGGDDKLADSYISVAEQRIEHWTKKEDTLFD